MSPIDLKVDSIKPEIPPEKLPVPTQKAEEGDPADHSVPLTESTKSSITVTIEDAEQQIGKEVLSLLAAKFNGKLSKVRPVDEKDLLF